MTAEQSAEIAAALTHISAGRLTEAESICRAVVTTNAGQAQAWHLLGGIALQQGRADEAIRCCSRAIALVPSLTKAHSNLGAALLAKGQIDEAIAALQAAIRSDANFAPAYVNLGMVLLKAGRTAESVAAFERAAALQPGDALARSNLGMALIRDKQLDDAVAVLTEATVLDPSLAAAHYNLGYARQKKGDYAEALSALLRAQTLQPNLVDVYATLGIVYRALGRPDEAVASYDKALALQPGHLNARFFRSMALLGQGQFAEGWHDYLARLSIRETSLPLHRQPLRADLAGQRIVLAKDQGLGDEIFFLRFVPALKRRGAHLTYRASGKIASMIRRLPFLDAVIEEAKVPPADLILSIGDLPFLLAMESVADIPPSITIPVLPENVAAQRAALGSMGPPPYIGVTWRAGTDHAGTLSKVVPLERIAAALRGAGGTLIALQRAPDAGEIAALSAAAGRPVHDMTGLNDRLEEMLALLALLDDYVAVSNTNVHLRAAVGRGSRVLVPWPPEFRWMTAGSVSPWFPDCVVYRQELDGSWEQALTALASDLVPSPLPVQHGSRTSS